MSEDPPLPPDYDQILASLMQFLEDGAGLQELVALIRALPEGPDEDGFTPMFGLGLDPQLISEAQRTRFAELLAAMDPDGGASPS